MTTRNPTNQSIAQPNKFQLVFERLPEVTFFCQDMVLPGISMNAARMHTPFVDINVAGDKLNFEPLNVSFILDEDYKTWLSIYDWMVGITFPEDFSQYRNLPNLKKTDVSFKGVNTFPQYSDATLIVNTNKNNPNIRFRFVDAFPVSLSPVNLTYTQGPEETLVCQATFAYSYFTRG